jgi:MFS family permease
MQQSTSTPTPVQHGSTARSVYPWVLVAMLWAVSFCNYADRGVLTAVMPNIGTEFKLSLTELGLLSSAFLWVYAIAATPAGYLGDRFSRKKVIMTGLVAWSIITFVSPLAASFMLFLVLRALTGLGEASYYPTGTALISDYHGPETRSRALAIHQTAVFAGGGFGTLIAAALAQHYQWRMPFYVYGALGVVLALVLGALMRDTPPAVRRQAQEGGSFAFALRRRSALMLFLVFFFATSVSYGITIWAPTFFHNVLHFNLTEAASYGALTINVAGFVAVLCSGAIADWAAQRVRMGRFYVLSGGLLLAFLFLVPFGFFRNPNLLGLCLLLSGFCKGLFDGSIYAAMHDVVPPAARSSAVGLMTTVGFAGAGLSPLVIGALGEIVGLGTAFSLIAVLYIAAVLLLLLSRRIVISDMDDTDRTVAAMGPLEEQMA